MVEILFLAVFECFFNAFSAVLGLRFVTDVGLTDFAEVTMNCIKLNPLAVTQTSLAPKESL